MNERFQKYARSCWLTVRLDSRGWYAYRCEGSEYRKLAEEIGIKTTELNRRMWHISRGKQH